VCANFNRWYNFTGSFQNPSATYYWQTVFGGFKKYDPKSGAPKGSLFKSCAAHGTSSVTINLTSASASFLGALSLVRVLHGEPDSDDQVRREPGERRR